MAEEVTAQDLAESLGMLQPDDVQWLLSEHLGIDLHDDVIPRQWCVEVHWILNPMWERTAAAPWYWTGHPVSPGTSPSTGEGSYDQFFDW